MDVCPDVPEFLTCPSLCCEQPSCVWRFPRFIRADAHSSVSNIFSPPALYTSDDVTLMSVITQRPGCHFTMIKTSKTSCRCGPENPNCPCRVDSLAVKWRPPVFASGGYLVKMMQMCLLQQRGTSALNLKYFER